MANDVLPPEGPPSGDIEAIARAIGAVINPLAQQQAVVQQSAIQADVEKFKIATNAREQQSKRGFILAIIAIIVVSSVIGAFVWAGQYQLALYALAFVAGAVTGAGGIKAIERARQ